MAIVDTRSIEWIGTPQMAEMEEPSKRCGKCSWKWKDIVEMPKEEEKGAVALVLDLAKAFERVSLFVIWAWRRISVSEKGAVRWMRGRAAINDHGYPAGVQVELLALRIVLQDALR